MCITECSNMLVALVVTHYLWTSRHLWAPEMIYTILAFPSYCRKPIQCEHGASEPWCSSGACAMVRMLPPVLYRTAPLDANAGQMYRPLPAHSRGDQPRDNKLCSSLELRRLYRRSPGQAPAKQGSSCRDFPTKAWVVRSERPGAAHGSAPGSPSAMSSGGARQKANAEYSRSSSSWRGGECGAPAAGMSIGALWPALPASALPRAAPGSAGGAAGTCCCGEP